MSSEPAYTLEEIRDVLEMSPQPPIVGSMLLSAVLIAEHAERALAAMELERRTDAARLAKSHMNLVQAEQRVQALEWLLDAVRMEIEDALIAGGNEVPKFYSEYMNGLRAAEVHIKQALTPPPAGETS